MLDRMSHKVLTFLRSQPDCTWRNNRGYHNTEIPKDEFLRTCDYLESKGYVAIDRVSGGVVSVSLTHYARHRRDFSWIAIKRYLLENWIAILALVIAAASLYISYKAWTTQGDSQSAQSAPRTTISSTSSTVPANSP